jgi:hypothetical protein
VRLVLKALAKLRVPFHGVLHDALLPAVQRVSVSMPATDASSVLSSLAKLGEPLEGGVRRALLKAVLLGARNMIGVEAPLAMNALACYDLAEEEAAVLQGPLCDAVVREGQQMPSFALVITAHALEALKWPGSEQMREAMQPGRTSWRGRVHKGPTLLN